MERFLCQGKPGWTGEWTCKSVDQDDNCEKARAVRGQEAKRSNPVKTMKSTFTRNFLLSFGLNLDMDGFLPRWFGLPALAAMMLLSGQARGQIAIQDGSPITVTTYTATPVSQLVTVTAGASVLVVLLEARDSAFTNDTVIPTWNGAALTQAVQDDLNKNTYRYDDIWYLLNPTPATANLVVPTMAGLDDISVTAYTLSGVNTSIAPLVGATNASSTGDTLTFDVTGVTGNSWAAVNAVWATTNVTPAITVSSGTPVTTTVTAAAASSMTAGYVSGLSPGSVTFTSVWTGTSQKAEFAAAIFTPAVTPAGMVALWTGAANANWDTTTTNWTSGVAATNYSDGDSVLFNDAAVASNVDLTANFSPGNVTVSNNMLVYVFGGPGGIGGNTSLTKQGTNNLTLNGTNTYNGATTVGGGALLVNGNNMGAGSLVVNSNATLGGSGAIAGAITIQSGGNLVPGAASATAGGTLTLSNNLTLANGSLTMMKVKTGSIGDQVASSGTVAYGGTLTVTNPGAALIAGDTFKLFAATHYTGSFGATNLPALGAGLAWNNTLIGNGTVAVVQIVPAVVTNLPSSNVQGASATLNGNVISTGNETPAVVLYYGPADGGTNFGNWSNSVALGFQGGFFSYAAAGLSNSTTYFYTAAATNSGGISWAIRSQSFTTLTNTPASAPASTQIQYLSGTDKDHTVPWPFYMTGGGRSNNVLTTIPVPSCWQTKGFGTYSYRNSPASTSVGLYTNIVFSVPASWAGQRIFLVFEGVLTDTAAVINGHSAGPVHQGGFYEFSYDVTTNVVAGANTNRLNVVVSEWSANTSVNQAEREGDYWNFSGIFRPVYLMAKPQSYIDRLAVDAQASGQINVNVFLGGITNNCILVASVAGANNVQLGSPFTNTVTAGMTNVLLSAMMPPPQLWSSEFPNLYNLTVQLFDTNNILLHMATNLIGFRTIMVSNNVGYFINGQKVVLRGVTRHEFWPNDGRTSSQAESDLDIGLIKDMNFNAVRMSHYPPNKVFLEECDRLGLYIFDELSGWQKSYDNTLAPELVKEMVIRDVNHPCIITWDNGNEGGWNTTVDNDGTGATNVYAIWDPQNRRVNRPGSGGTAFNGVVDEHYPGWSGGSSFTGGLGAGKSVYLPTEINHANYDGGAGSSLSDYWDLMRTSPNGAGMFVWAFLDEGLVRDDEGGQIDVQDSAAPDGIVGPYRQPEASYYTYKSTYNPAQVTGPAPGAALNGTLAVENRFSFTSLNQCTFDWQLGWFPDANDPAGTFNTSTNALTGGLLVALDSGNFTGPDVAPGATGSLVLPGFPVNGTNYDALRLTAADPSGNNLYTWTWPLHTPAQIHDRLLGAVSMSAPAISAGTNASEIIVTNGPRVFHFSRTTGVINSLTVSNQNVSFTNGPVLLANSWNITSITNYSDGTNYFIMANNLNSSTNAFQWSLRPDGWLKLTYVYTLTGSNSFMGITFSYPSNNVTGMSWLGRGPYRVYKNRTIGQEVFVHTKAYNYTWTGQGTLIAPTTTPWVYPEFEGYHGQLNWATLLTTEQPVTFVTTASNLFFCILTPPAVDVANVNPVYPSGAISFLDGIAPQGEKFHAASAYGPSAAVNVAAGLYSNAVDFFFGPPPPSGADRDRNGLIDAWELQYFGALGQNPGAASADNGLSLALANAFGLSPTNADPNVSRLPEAGRGTAAPIALLYRVPVSQLDYFSYIPQVTDNLVSNWFGADQYPQYFLINTVPTNGIENACTVQPNLTAWPGNTNHLFLRLQIDIK
jgi:autotransporter-associated beta strand protein